MAMRLIACMIIITFIVADVALGRTQGSFPLKDCLNEDTDLVWLMENDRLHTQYTQTILLKRFFVMASESMARNGNAQLFVAIQHDWFTAHNVTIDISHRSFNYTVTDYSDRDMEREALKLKMPVNDISTTVELKTRFVERMFNEMSGGRDTANHIGVVFLDGYNLTQEEIRSVPSIVQRRRTDVKIFVVIIGNRLVHELVHLTDTIVLPSTEISNYAQHLLMAMCNMCAENYVPFEHTTGGDILSCYLLEYRWRNEMASLGFLAGIETAEEMTFLQKYLITKNTVHNSENVQINIGLKRNLNTYAKRFQWTTTPGKYSPVFVHHWMPGKPSRGYVSTDCGVWQFTRNWTSGNNVSNIPQDVLPYNGSFIEGWTNVECRSQSSLLALTEVVLPQRLQDSAFINIVEAPKESVNWTLEKGNFFNYRRNIVSMSANLLDEEFLQFLRDSNEEFPIFDCGDDVVVNRYISYSMVCDFVDHCSNKQDEVGCKNPRDIFDCGDDVVVDKYISYSMVCDSVENCSNKKDELDCMNPRNIYGVDENFCASGQRPHISQFRCDNVKDCIDGSDEVNCIHYPCNSLRCFDGSCLPLQWLNDGELDCFTCKGISDFTESDESSITNMHLMNKKSCALICNRETCINFAQLNDGKRDCNGPEGPLDETIGKLDPADTCKNRLGDFIWAPVCHYIMDRYGDVIGCRDLSHLRSCEDFPCGQGYVKCPKSYCIPQHYLRDQKADCPRGEDENPFYIGPCVGHFACYGSQVCLHLDLVCNGYPDCPHQDDEIDCKEFCPKGFRCIAGAVTVLDYNSSVPLNMSSLPSIDRRTRYLDLSGVELQEFDKFISQNKEVFLNLKVLIMSKCNISRLYEPTPIITYYSSTSIITHVRFYVPPFMIKKLDVSYNAIPEIFTQFSYTNYYKDIIYLNVSYNRDLTSVKNLRLRYLEILDLSYTSISCLNESVFAELPRLKHLNLSHSLISDFTRSFFPKPSALQSLDLRGILTKDFQDYVFHDLTISQKLYTDYFQICCPQIRGYQIPSHACIAPADDDTVSSCFHLIGLDVQRVLLWLVAVIAVLGNTTVIVFRIIWDRAILKTGYGLFVTNLGVSDFIMGVYLFIIAGADHLYRGNYVFNDNYWRNGVVCKFAGFMACLSCEASTFFVFLITLDRFLVVKFPFGQIKFSRFTKSVAVTVSWVTSFLLSLVPIVFSFDIYSSNAMCLGLPLTTTNAKGSGYAVGVFIICNLVMFLFIAYGQYAIFRAMSDNRISKTATSMSYSRRAKEITVAKQLSLVVLSNFLFWFPVGLMGLLSLGGHEVGNAVYAWTTVLLLPINSAINPVLYTIPAVMARWEKFKHGDQTRLSASL